MDELETTRRALAVEMERYQTLAAQHQLLLIDHDQLTARVDELEAENARLQAELDALTPEDPANVRAAAITALMTSTAPSDVATRAFLRDVYTAINLIRVHLGWSKEDEDSIVPRVIAGVRGGLGDPIPPESLPGGGG